MAKQTIRTSSTLLFRRGQIIEVSTKDTVEDNYRVFPGDSQK